MPPLLLRFEWRPDELELPEDEVSDALSLLLCVADESEPEDMRLRFPLREDRRSFISFFFSFRLCFLAFFLFLFVISFILALTASLPDLSQSRSSCRQ